MLPKVVFFDYGQTLIGEKPFCGIEGTRALMGYVSRNPHNYSAEYIHNFAENISLELGRLDSTKRHLFNTEIPFDIFESYLCTSLGLELTISIDRMEEIFWDNASPAYEIEGANELLLYLKEKGIRTFVVSNMMYSEETLRKRLNKFLPDNEFEDVIVSSKYLFRKPNRRIFELALEKAGVFADEALFVGDSLECDVKGAIKAGIKPVWITLSEENDGITKIKSIIELKEFIENGSLL